MAKEKKWVPNGWSKDKPFTEKDAKEVADVLGVMGTGLSADDFNDDGSDLDELNEILRGDE